MYRQDSARTQEIQDHPHCCLNGFVYLGYTYTGEDGEEYEAYEALPCRRCAEEAEVLPPAAKEGVMRTRVHSSDEILLDVYDSIVLVATELEAMNACARAMTTHLTGEDPLRDDLYYGDGAQQALFDDDIEPPDWVSSGAKDRVWEGISEELVSEQINSTRVAAYIMGSAFLGVLFEVALVLYMVS